MVGFAKVVVACVSISFLMINSLWATGVAQLSVGDREAIRSIMATQYGDQYLEEHRCWNYAFDDGRGDSTPYCMTVGGSRITDEDGVRILYFFAFSRAGVGGNTEFTYAHHETGLMGVFKAVLIAGSKKWRLVAANKEMPFGTSGSCGCELANFLRLGRKKFGWMFASGGVWQGAVVTNYAIVTDFNGAILDVSAIPQVEEHDQETSYIVEVAPDDLSEEMFPLLVHKSRNGSEIGQYRAVFNRASRLYELSH